MRLVYAILGCLLTATGASAAGICLEPSPNGINGTWNCEPVPELRPHYYQGYSVDGVPCEGDEPFRPVWWTISSSDVDPNHAQGPLPIAPDLATLYLWVYHENHWWPEETGATAAEFNLVTDGPSLFLVSVEPMNGAVNLSTAPETVQIVLPFCVENSVFLAARLNMFYLGPVSVERGTWGSVKAMYR